MKYAISNSLLFFRLTTPNFIDFGQLFPCAKALQAMQMYSSLNLVLTPQLGVIKLLKITP